jgi:hypothetical protein
MKKKRKKREGGRSGRAEEKGKENKRKKRSEGRMTKHLTDVKPCSINKMNQVSIAFTLWR